MTASARRSNDVRRGRLPIAILAAAAFVSLLAGVGATDAEAKKKKQDAATSEAPAAKSDPSALGASTPNATKIPPSFPKTVDEAKAEAEAAKKPPEKWT